MRPVWNLPLDRSGIEVELDNGVHVRIRPGRPDDREALTKAFERFSEHSRYMRFFGVMPKLNAQVATALSDIDDEHQLAWMVSDPAEPSEVGDGSGLAIASARLFVDDDDPTTAEATLAIVDDYQGRGLGRFLIELLVSTAALYSIRTIRFDVLAENRAMRGLLRKIGARGTSLPDDRTIVRYLLEIPDNDSVDPTVGALYVLLRRATDTISEPDPDPDPPGPDLPDPNPDDIEFPPDRPMS